MQRRGRPTSSAPRGLLRHRSLSATGREGTSTRTVAGRGAGDPGRPGQSQDPDHARGLGADPRGPAERSPGQAPETGGNRKAWSRKGITDAVNSGTLFRFSYACENANPFWSTCCHVSFGVESTTCKLFEIQRNDINYSTSSGENIDSSLCLWDILEKTPCRDEKTPGIRLGRGLPLRRELLSPFPAKRSLISE